MSANAAPTAQAATNSIEVQDGAAFYRGDSLHVSFYDRLYGDLGNRYGDVAWYDTLAEHTGKRILDAACGSGRILQALAKPGRSLTGFDASAELLAIANTKAAAVASPECHILLSPQRLETFTFKEQFDLIIVGYYAFSNLLHPALRHSCLKQIAAHLAPNGRAVLHLPAAELLRREVAPEELQAMRAEYSINTGLGPSLKLLQFVSAMQYDAASKVRSMDLHAVLTDEGSNILKHDPRRLYYACITAEELAAEAAAAGLSVVNTRSGFKQQTGTELVAVLIHAKR